MLKKKNKFLPNSLPIHHCYYLHNLTTDQNKTYKEQN